MYTVFSRSSSLQPDTISCTISVRTIDSVGTTVNNPGFTFVEKTVWHEANGGTLSNTDSIQTLVMGGNGTFGALRFRSGAGEMFLVTLGVHNNKWCDVVTNLAPGKTVHPEYYGPAGSRNDGSKG